MWAYHTEPVEQNFKIEHPKYFLTNKSVRIFEVGDANDRLFGNGWSGRLPVPFVLSSENNKKILGNSKSVKRNAPNSCNSVIYKE